MEYDPERITLFAKTDARGQNIPFGIKAKDRARHVYVIGKTGMGKSTLLENMAVQDIKNGEGMAFIDPHGQTAETLLDYIPPERVKDVLYFAPFDMEHPVSFNVMEDVGADKRHLVVSGLMSTFKKIWVDAWSARMEYILSNTLLALLEYPDSTLLGVNRMLSDKVYRKKVIENIKDPAVKSFWVDEFLKYNERYMQEAGDAIKNKTGQFTANPLIRNIIGQPKSSFDIRKMMDERKIIIMNLSKGLIGETNANLLGSMLITRIYLAAMSRAEMSPQELAKMSNFYFFVDEFQSFANEAFANILSEARKYKLNLTIAHQYIEQMEEEVRNAVFGNVGTTISFRVGPFDAEVLETIFQPKFYAVDICNLGFAQIYLTLMIDGVGSQPFSAQTLPPIQHEGESCKEMVIHQSREQFAHGRAIVEKAINDWHGVDESGEQIGKREPHKNNQGDRSRQSRDDTHNHASSRNGNSRQNSNGPRNNHRQERAEQGKSNSSRNHGNDKSLDDLRSILSGISNKNTDTKSETQSVLSTSRKPNHLVPEPEKQETSSTSKSEPTPQKPPQKAHIEQKKRESKPEQDLRSALSGALAEVVAEAKDQQGKQPKQEHKPTPKAAAPKARQPHTPKPAQSEREPVQQARKTQPKEKKNNLDPKELERMMRLHTNDKTPLK